MYCSAVIVIIRVKGVSLTCPFLVLFFVLLHRTGTKRTAPHVKVAYLCMAKCNDNVTMSSEAVSACMRRCEQPLQGINQVVQQEMGGMQVKLSLIHI